MIEEAYVSFETAKLLKEKGFNEPCFSYYLTTKTLHTTFHNRVHVEDEPHFNCLNIENAYDIKDKSLFEDICSAPTLQRAMKWLREVHNIYYEIKLLLGEKAEKYGRLQLGIYQQNSLDTYVWKDWIYADTYVELYENHIKYCLENLIK